MKFRCFIALLSLVGVTHAQAPITGQPEFLDRMCFAYGKKGWEIVSTAKQRKWDEARAKELVEKYFPPEAAEEQKALIARVYSGEIPTAEDFGSHLYFKCLDALPPHPQHQRPSPESANDCFKQLALPHYVFVKKYSDRISKSELIAGLPTSLEQNQVKMLQTIANAIYATDDPEEHVTTYWLVFASCNRTQR